MKMSKNDVKFVVENLLQRFAKLETQTKIDELTDGIIETGLIRRFMESLDLKLPDEEYANILGLLDPMSEGVVRITELIDKLENFLLNMTKKDEMIEAFRIFDKQNTGQINVSKFRLILKKYLNIENEVMDEMIMDMLEMKKLAPIDPMTNLDYLKFADKIFETA